VHATSALSLAIMSACTKCNFESLKQMENLGADMDKNTGHHPGSWMEKLAGPLYSQFVEL
jgi:hypothetical protein